MQTKIIPVVGDGYTKEFFFLSIADADMSYQPHLEVPNVTNAQFALWIGDNGLSNLNAFKGDYALFCTTSLLKSSGQIALIRQEEEYIIREAYWTPDKTLLRVPSDIYEPLELPTENIRIVAVLDNIIKDREDLKMVYFD